MNVVGANRGDGMRVLLALLDDLVIVKAHQLLVLDSVKFCIINLIEENYVF